MYGRAGTTTFCDFVAATGQELTTAYGHFAWPPTLLGTEPHGPPASSPAKTTSNASRCRDQSRSATVVASRVLTCSHTQVLPRPEKDNPFYADVGDDPFAVWHVAGGDLENARVVTGPARSLDRSTRPTATAGLPRRHRLGVVADYVPFYFAPRSPMMYVIERGGVPTYNGGCDQLVYLTTTVERLLEVGIRPIFTDRNATIAYASFTDDVTALDSSIDWTLMDARDWYDTLAAPDRKERRMAECLIHQRVPWEAFHAVCARRAACARRATEILSTAGVAATVTVRPAWYY